MQGFYGRLISTFFLFCPLSPRPLTHFCSKIAFLLHITSCLKLRNGKTMKARGLGTRNSIVNFLPVFEKYSSFERTVFSIVMLTDALELRETNHFLVDPAVIHLDFPHTPCPWFLLISVVQFSLVRIFKKFPKIFGSCIFHHSSKGIPCFHKRLFSFSKRDSLTKPP